MRIFEHGIEVNLRVFGIGLLIVAVLFLGVQYVRLSGTTKAIARNADQLRANQEVIVRSLIEKKIIQVKQPQPQVDASASPQSPNEPDNPKAEKGKNDPQ